MIALAVAVACWMVLTLALAVIVYRQHVALRALGAAHRELARMLNSLAGAPVLEETRWPILDDLVPAFVDADRRRYVETFDVPETAAWELGTP